MRILSLTVLMLALTAIGCDNEPAPPASPPNKPAPATQPIIPVTQIIDWCPEHAVPESICTRCNSSLIAGFKAKRDWCDEHGLPDSQCFKHHPELQAKFAAAFKAQYGKEPPPMQPH